jgi:hypothetical protein
MIYLLPSTHPLENAMYVAILFLGRSTMILTTVPVSSTQEICVELRGSKFQGGRSTSIKANNTDLENLSFSNFLDGAGLIVETALHRPSMYGCQG